MSNALPLLFDTLYWLFWTIVYTSSAALSVLVADRLWGPSVLSRAFALVVAYLVFLHAFVVILGVLKRLVQPRLQPGRSKAGGGRAFLAWGLNSVFQGIFTAAFCADQIHLLFWLRYLHYRLMGMKLHPSTIIGTGAVLRQVEMIELGRNVTLGIGVTLSCHVNPDGKSHMQLPIRIGEGTLIGTGSRIGPGVVVGDHCVVGGDSTLCPEVVVGNHARIGAHCFIRSGVRIGDGARVPVGSLVDRDLPAGAKWGEPAATPALEPAPIHTEGAA